MKLKVEMKSMQEILQNHGLQEGGSVQKLVDSERMRYMSDYMPRRQAGELEHMMVLSTVIGSGEINTPGPYAHYLYEGVLYVSPTTGSAWAKKNEINLPALQPGVYIITYILADGNRENEKIIVTN